MSKDDIRNAIARELVMDDLLGVHSAPLRLKPRAASSSSRSAHSSPAAPNPPMRERPAPPVAKRPASAATKDADDLAPQNISPAELARREKELRVLDEQQVKTCRKCKLC